MKIPLIQRGVFSGEEVVGVNVQCPMCDATFAIPATSEVAEIITCRECRNKLEIVSTQKTSGKALVKEAPKVEEDWGQ